MIDVIRRLRGGPSGRRGGGSGDHQASSPHELEFRLPSNASFSISFCFPIPKNLPIFAVCPCATVACDSGDRLRPFKSFSGKQIARF